MSKLFLCFVSFPAKRRLESKSVHCGNDIAHIVSDDESSYIHQYFSVINIAWYRLLLQRAFHAVPQWPVLYYISVPFLMGESSGDLAIVVVSCGN